MRPSIDPPFLPAELCALFLAAGGGANNTPVVELLAEGRVSWSNLLLLMERERATSILWEQLRDLHGLTIPTSYSARMRKLARIAEFKMSYLEQRTTETVGVLNAVGENPVLLKGAALALTMYGSFARRPMLDVDVLLSGADACENAKRALLEAGWACTLDPELNEAYAGLHHLPPLYDARVPDIKLELHTELLPTGNPFLISSHWVADNSRPVRVGRHAARVLRPEAQLVHTCVHFAWSHMARSGAWRTFRDVNCIVSRFFDWEDFASLVSDTRATTACYWTLRLARALSRTAVPEYVLEQLRPPLPEFVLVRLERHFCLILAPPPSGCPSIRLRRLLWSAGILPSWSGHSTARPWLGPGKDIAAVLNPRARANAGSNRAQQASELTAHLRHMLFAAR